VSILVINSGSSSLKFELFEGESLESKVSGLIDWAGDKDSASVSIHSFAKGKSSREEKIAGYGAAIKHILNLLGREKSGIAAVGHRIVHGGALFCDAVLIDDDVKDAISGMSELAPLHNPPALEAIEALEEELPGIPQTALFDTAYYADMPLKSVVYPLPYEWYEEWGIRRYGFHGISHADCAQRATRMLNREMDDLRIVSCHLGNGCSATATQGGKAVATTMGFTPVEGLMMGSRSGSVDPGILIYLQKKKGLSVEELDHTLNKKSGLLGISGLSSDFRKVEQAAAEGNRRARLALELFIDRLEGAIASLAAVMKGIDILIFTGGIGENAFKLRKKVCEDLRFMGIRLNASANSSCSSDAEISQKKSAVRVIVIMAGEERFIADKTRAMIKL